MRCMIYQAARVLSPVAFAPPRSRAYKLQRTNTRVRSGRPDVPWRQINSRERGKYSIFPRFEKLPSRVGIPQDLSGVAQRTVGPKIGRPATMAIAFGKMFRLSK